MDAFRLELIGNFSNYRDQISGDLPDDELSHNPAYLNCVKIKHALEVIYESQDGYDFGEMVAAIDDYNVDKFLSHIHLELIKTESGYLINIKFDEIPNDPAEDTQQALS